MITKSYVLEAPRLLTVTPGYNLMLLLQTEIDASVSLHLYNRNRLRRFFNWCIRFSRSSECFAAIVAAGPHALSCGAGAR